MNLKLLATFLVGALLASAALNVAQYRQHSSPKRKGPRPPAPYEEMDLTKSQIAVLNRCGTKCCDEAEALRAEASRVTTELQVLLSAESLDENQIKEKADELCSLRNQEVDNNISTLLEVRNTLKPKQVRALYRVLYPEEAR